jgi:hypothetical protein
MEGKKKESRSSSSDPSSRRVGVWWCARTTLDASDPVRGGRDVPSTYSKQHWGSRNNTHT